MKKITIILKSTYILLLTLIALIICSSSVGFSVFAVISLGTYLSLIALLIFITGRKQLSLVIASSLVIILQLMSQLKVHYYKERMFFPDLYIAFDPNNLGTLLQYPSGLLAVIGLCAFLFVNIIAFRKHRPLSIKIRCFCLLIAILLFSLSIHISRQKEHREQWQLYLPKGRGTIVNLFISAQTMAYSPPFYNEDARYFLQKAQDMMAKPPAKSSPNKPDIVVFLQESALNPALFAFDTQSLPKLDMFNQYMGGLLRVQTFGGGTWLSEFSVLTGLNTNDFTYRKNSVFYTVSPHIQTSLFKELNDSGYMTVVLSPMGYGNYNAGATYTNLGMQKFFQPQDLGYPADKTENLWHIPTQAMIDYTKKLMATYTDKPLFIYVLSMDEHGPYDAKTPDNYQLASLTGDQQFAGRLSDYLPRIERLNTATLDLIDYIQQRDKPTLLLYFGDHQPAMNWQGQYKTALKNPAWLTQYSLTANYSFPQEDNEVTDISLLSGLVLEKANIPTSAFYKANIAMRYLCKGKLDECEDTKLVNSYKNYIYQVLQNAGKTSE